MTTPQRLAIIVLILTLTLGMAQAQPLEKQGPVPEEDSICFALYTVHDGILKLTAQMYPLDEYEERTVQLQVRRLNHWKTIAEAPIVNPGWTATFRVENWDQSKTKRYRIAYRDKAFYEGTIQKDPVDKDTITVAAFTGNSIYKKHGGTIPKTDIVENLKKIKPDLLFFSGDQVYDHKRHYDYWITFGEDFGDIIRDTPTICIPDDHDVGHANLWGAGGKVSKVPQGHDGGYFMPVEYVNMVQRAQTAHLPDPYDPTPILRDISVYYTQLTWGRISFAIIEDRKWKSGPEGLIPNMGPRPDHVSKPDYDPAALDVPEAVLLGERQLTFLDEWGQDWTDADMKAVLSQTIFCGGAHLHGQLDNRILADLDSNGWPQTGRNKALHEIRKSFSVMIAGDQHLGSIYQHGIEDWNDAGYSLCVPSIANLYLRWWAPLEPGKNRKPGAPDYTGEFVDGFDNKMTVHAVANPDPVENHDKLTTRAAGFGIAKFHKPTREITLELWPRKKDITDPATEQYQGWPLTIHQEDNYARKAAAWLPEITVKGQKNPVIQVIEEATGEVVYTLRINGNSYQPKVFKEGLYTVHVGEEAARQSLKGIEASTTKEMPGITVKL